MRTHVTWILMFLFLNHILYSQDFVIEKKQAGAFPLVSSSQAASIYVDENDDWLVHKAASLLKNDIETVTGTKPENISTLSSPAKNVIIIGTIKKSPIIASLAENGKVNVADVKGKWESFLLQVVDHPTKDIQHALVIAGSDKRGTAYGVFELSRQIGVSPWYWWADVPVKKKKEIYIKNDAYKGGPPSVKYRGIFIND